MATETKNLKLNKPDKTDFYNIDLVNANMDKIDGAIAEKANKTDIPTSLPANGGNADTLGGKSASDFIARQHKDTISTFDDIIVAGVYRINEFTQELIIPTEMTQYGQLLVLNGDNSDTVTQIYCNFENNKIFSRSCHNWGKEPSNWTNWSKINDGGNADTVDGIHANDFVLHLHRQADTTIVSNNNYKTSYECSIPDNIATSLGLPNCWWHLKYFKHEDNNGFGVQMAFPLNNGTIKPMYRLSNGTNGWNGWTYFADGGNADTVDGLHVDSTLGNQSLKPIIASTTDLTAVVSSLSQGTIYIVYE